VTTAAGTRVSRNNGGERHEERGRGATATAAGMQEKGAETEINA
jgi:hypothetical protein